MAQSSFSRTLSDVKNVDGSLSRTLSENSYSSSGTSFTNSTILTKIRGNQKTPSRTPMKPVTPREVSNNSKADIATPLRNKKTPSSLNKILDCEGDRYIPNRISTDITRAQNMLNTAENGGRDTDSQYRRAVGESLNTTDSTDCRILKFKGGIRGTNTAQVISTANASPKRATCQRHIPRTPEKVLDAPELMDDFYLNILDWSADNMIAIALSQEVYVWNAVSGDITCLMSSGLEDEYVTSLRWCPDVPSVLGVGLSAGRIQLWNVENQRLLRTMRMGDSNAAGRIPSLAWRDHIISSGSRSGHVRQHDTRIAAHEVGLTEFHTQEVCGLAWSPDKRYLASGANDNCVAVWSSSVIGQRSGAEPHVTLRDHQSAIKAIAWCPWKPSLLSTGGGMADHSLKFWNATAGNCVKSVDVKAQVSGIIWNSEYREIITSHGGVKNQLVIWQYPDIRQVAELSEHQGRVLCMASSPNNEMVASCAADETLRIWHCFQVDNTKKKAQDKPHVPAYARPIR